VAVLCSLQLAGVQPVDPRRVPLVCAKPVHGFAFLQTAATLIRR
jgi:hypothetical protein